MDAPRRILVVGGGPAGTFAAIAAKKQDPAAVVTLLSEEPCEPYEKPPLSKAVLLGTAAPGDAPIAGPGGLASHGVAFEPRAHVAAVDCAARSITLSDGRILPYDALVIATGAVPRIIPQLPVGMPRVHYLRTETDAETLKADLRECRHVLVVGGGLIGLEVAASAAKLGIQTTVLEVLPRILARVCDETTGTAVHDAHRQHGVDIRVGTGLHAASEEDGRFRVETSDGRYLHADVIVVGAGARPDDRLAVAAGLTVDDGIVVNERCRTSDPHVFAAGDVVRFPGPQGLVRLENWRHAQDQGTVAGRNAAGGDEIYAAIPSFWTEQYDLYLQGVGWPVTGARQVRRQLPGNGMLVFEILEGRLTYAMGINAQRDLAMARRLIERKVPVDPAALADPGQPLAAMLRPRA